jgi:aspartyl-tRNA(Asn)/glutamyl-tRNA(Gln) amidotransferase subunit C
MFMSISEKDVMYVADLARLTLDEASIATFADQIGKILDHMDSLRQVDTTGVEPTNHAILLNNAFREDDQKPHPGSESALENAPLKESGQFVVPKIIG